MTQQATPRHTEESSEFQGRGLLILASAVGLSVGMTATMFYSLGAFIPPLQSEFGWDRGDISLAVTIMTVGLFVSGPLAGRLCDRFGAAAVGTFSLLSYAAAVAAMASMVTSVEVFWIAYFIIAVLGAGSTPIVLVRPISAAFSRNRGLALGSALTGAGLAGFWVPNLVAQVVENWGWRTAYFALAAAAMVAAPLVWIGFRTVETGPDMRGPSLQEGLTAREARRTRRYWLLTAMALTMAVGIAGVVVHLVPLFRDLGTTTIKAARLASVVGLSSVVGRIIVGLLLDRFKPTLVSMIILALAAVGILLLWSSGLQYALLSVALLGLAAGAEIDLLAYLTARYFGQLAYGAIYGWQYSVFALGYGLSPFLVGRMRDHFGSYDLALLASAGLMVVAALTSLGLSSDDRLRRQAI